MFWSYTDCTEIEKKKPNKLACLRIKEREREREVMVTAWVDEWAE